MDFNPANNIWRAEDGRLFSSARMAEIAKGDPDVKAFEASGGVITIWPRDTTGAQTQEALDDVLRAYGLLASGTSLVQTTKLDFYRRMTDAEADAVEMALAGAKVRERRMFEEAQILDHADADFARLRENVVGMFGEARADELLAPSSGA